MLLRRAVNPAFEQDAMQFVRTITATIMPALGWLTSPAAAAEQDGVGAGFDVALLASVFLLAAEETGGDHRERAGSRAGSACRASPTVWKVAMEAR